MQRVLASTIFLLIMGLAAAQPPVDFTIECDGELIGTATYVDGELHASIVEGVECTGDLTVTQDPDVFVELERADGETTVTLTSATEGSVTGDVEELSSEALELPGVAIEGMATAQENRAAAAESGAEGEADADAEVSADAAADVDAEVSVDANVNASEGAGNADEGIGNANDEADPDGDADERASEGSGNAEVDVEVGGDGAGVGVGADAAGEARGDR